MKWFGWFGKLVASALLLSFLSVFTTVYVVDQYIQGFLKKWNLPEIERPAFDPGDYAAALIRSGIGERSEKPTEAGERTEAGEQAEAGTPETGAQNPTVPHAESGPRPEDGSGIADFGDTNRQTGETPPGGEQEDVQAVPVFGSAALSRFGDALVMSEEEFNEKRKRLSDDDKMEIFSIMMARLPQEELQRMSLLLEEGITAAEAAEIEEVIYAYLQQDEVARLLAILSKY